MFFSALLSSFLLASADIIENPFFSLNVADDFHLEHLFSFECLVFGTLCDFISELLREGDCKRYERVSTIDFFLGHVCE